MKNKRIQRIAIIIWMIVILGWLIMAIRYFIKDDMIGFAIFLITALLLIINLIAHIKNLFNKNA